MSDQLGNCPFCGGRNTLIEEGTKIWLGTRYGEPANWKISHWCIDGRSTIQLKDKLKQTVINNWNKRT